MPHEEVNENGHRSTHPGYETRNCSVCGKPFLIAVTSKDTICGRKGCDERRGGGVATKERP